MRNELKDMFKTMFSGVCGIAILLVFVTVLVGGGALVIKGLSIWFKFIGMK